MFKPIEAVASPVQTYCPSRHNIGVVQETHYHWFPPALTFEVVASGTSYSTQKCSGYVELAPGDSTEVTSGNSVASVPIIFENLDGQRYRRRPRRGRITRRLLGDRGRVIALRRTHGSDDTGDRGEQQT
jgi:hypothetical protein